MRTRRLGKSCLQVPVIGLGTWSVFDSDADRTPLVAAALAAGVNLFDSSPMYGTAEDRLADALGARRGEALIATKISAAEADIGLAQIRHGLELFGNIDLYQIHNIVSWQKHLPALERLKAAGRCQAIGASQGLLVSDHDLIEVMRTGLIDSIQIRFNPRRRGAEARVLPLADELGIGVIVMQPLRWGVLLAEPAQGELQSLQVDDWGQAILRWILSEPRVTMVLTGTSNPLRIKASAAVAALPPFTPDQRHMVEQILDRNIAPSTHERITSTEQLAHDLGAFLIAHRGASYCMPCLSREFSVSEDSIISVRQALPVPFAVEDAACLVCGKQTTIVRSRTIMR